jgi:hypothetical protein
MSSTPSDATLSPLTTSTTVRAQMAAPRSFPGSSSDSAAAAVDAVGIRLAEGKEAERNVWHCARALWVRRVAGQAAQIRCLTSWQVAPIEHRATHLLMTPHPLELPQVALEIISDDETMPDPDTKLVVDRPWRGTALALVEQEVKRLEDDAVLRVLERDGGRPAPGTLLRR